jgi:hypothetical protein
MLAHSPTLFYGERMPPTAWSYKAREARLRSASVGMPSAEDADQ